MELLSYMANFTVSHIENEALLEKAAYVIGEIVKQVQIEGQQLRFLSHIINLMLKSKSTLVKSLTTDIL